MNEDPVREQELEHQQGALYPVGRSLRSTFGPPEDEVLQPAITRLMVELSHQPFGPDQASSRATAPPAESAGTLRRLLARLLHR